MLLRQGACNPLNNKFGSHISSESTASPITCNNCVTLNSIKVKSCISLENLSINVLGIKLEIGVFHCIAHSINCCYILHCHIVFVIFVLKIGLLSIVCCWSSISSVFWVFFKTHQMYGFIWFHHLEEKLSCEKLRMIGKHNLLLNTTERQRSSS